MAPRASPRRRRRRRRRRRPAGDHGARRPSRSGPRAGSPAPPRSRLAPRRPLPASPAAAASAASAASAKRGPTVEDTASLPARLHSTSVGGSGLAAGRPVSSPRARPRTQAQTTRLRRAVSLYCGGTGDGQPQPPSAGAGRRTTRGPVPPRAPAWAREWGSERVGRVFK